MIQFSNCTCGALVFNIGAWGRHVLLPRLVIFEVTGNFMPGMSTISKGLTSCLA